jgi:hypothetical protein
MAMKLLYADTWMIEALKAANKTPVALLDIPTLLNTLSEEDVAFYLGVNKNLAEFLPKPLVSSFKPVEFKLQGWISEKQVKKVEDLLEARRLSSAKLMPEEANDADKMLTIDILNDEVLLVHYIDRKDVSMQTNLDKALWVSEFAERVIRQMSAFVTFDKLAALPIFRWYLQARRVVLEPNTVV